MARNCESALEPEHRDAETFRRIHRLYKQGFRPDWSVTNVEDAIWWMHPGGYPNLILYPDGMVVASNSEAELSPHDHYDKHRILNQTEADIARFDGWLRSVRKPTWWQAGQYARERYIMMPIGIVILYGLLWLFATGIEKVARAIWHSLTG